MSVRTLEGGPPDDPDDPSYVVGVRHAECVRRTDLGFYALVPEEPPDDGHPAGEECWGCGGWLHEPPLTPEETARLRVLWGEGDV